MTDQSSSAYHEQTLPFTLNNRSSALLDLSRAKEALHRGVNSSLSNSDYKLEGLMVFVIAGSS